MCKNSSSNSWRDAICNNVIPVICNIFTAIAVLYVGWLLNDSISKAEHNLSVKKNEIDIIDRFHKVYNQEKSVGMSLCLLELINEPDTEFKLRQYVTWDLLSSVIKCEENKQGSFHFTPDEDAWHFLGENFEAMLRLDEKKGIEFIKAVVDKAPRTYKTFSNQKEITELFDWVSETYEMIGERLF